LITQHVAPKKSNLSSDTQKKINYRNTSTVLSESAKPSSLSLSQEKKRPKKMRRPKGSRKSVYKKNTRINLIRK
jgi:hypothetical protein